MNQRERLKRLNIEAEADRVPNVGLIRKTFSVTGQVTGTCPDCQTPMPVGIENSSLAECNCPKCGATFWYIKATKEWKVVKEALSMRRRYVPKSKPFDRNARRRIRQANV
jgi:hypothetical protein